MRRKEKKNKCFPSKRISTDLTRPEKERACGRREKVNKEKKQ